MERAELKESTVGMVGCGFQDDSCRDGVAGSPGVEYNIVEVVGVEDRRPIVGPVFDTTCGQLPTRPAGLLQTVGRTSSSRLYALVRFRLLDKREGKN